MIGYRLGYERSGVEVNGARLVALELSQDVGSYFFVTTAASTRRIAQASPFEIDASTTVVQAGFGAAVGEWLSAGLHAGPAVVFQERVGTTVGGYVGAFLELPLGSSAFAVRMAAEDLLRFAEEGTVLGPAVAPPEHDISLRAGLTHRTPGGLGRLSGDNGIGLSLFAVRRASYETHGFSFAGTNAIGGELSLSVGPGVFLLAGARSRPPLLDENCVLDEPPPCGSDGGDVIASLGVGYVRPILGISLAGHVGGAAETGSFRGDWGLLWGAFADFPTPFENLSVRVGADDYVTDIGDDEANQHDWLFKVGLVVAP